MPANNTAQQPSCDSDPASISVDRARACIDDAITPMLATQTVSLKDSLGRVLATDVVSTLNVPNHTNSAMDGYAFAAADLQHTMEFTVAGNAFAGAPFSGAVRQGQCVRIMTGAIMPAGTDTVIMQERTAANADRVTFLQSEKSGCNVRYAGEDVNTGDVVFSKGTRVGASQLGVMASLGMLEVEVFCRPKIAYFSNGDELKAVGTPLAPGEVYDSNRYTLHAMLKEFAVEEIDLGVVADDRAAISAALTAAAEQADLIITTAGASVGDADYMKEVLASMGEISFWKVAIKPGRPMSFGKSGNALFFGLPGNPVSVMVTFQIFLKPAIRRLCGEKHNAPLTLKMRTTTDLKKRPGRMEYQRGVMSQNQHGETVVTSTGEQGSGILSSMAQANCFIILNHESTGAKAGEWVEIQPFGAGES